MCLIQFVSLLEFPVAKIASLVSQAKSVKGLVLENMLTGDLLQRPVSVVVYHSIVVVAIVLLPRLIIKPVIQHLEEMFTT